MSYILDALRKSEQQRQVGALPRLLAVQPAFETEPPPAFLRYGLIAAGLLGAGVALGWLHPWQQAKPLSAAAPLPEEGLDLRPPPSAVPVLPEIRGNAARKEPAPEPRKVIEPVRGPEAAPRENAYSLVRTPDHRKEPPLASPPVVTPRQGVAGSPREATALPVPKQAAAPAQAQPANPAPADARQASDVIPQEVIPMAELPAAMQQEIPAMSIPVHTYSSTPTERIVGINDRLLQEGDYVAPGLKVEEIAPDGVVFSYKSYRFRRGL